MSRHMPARLNQREPRQQFRAPVHQPNALHGLIPLGSIGSKTWVARRIQMMHTLNNIVRLRECRVSSGMVDIIMRRNDCLNIVRLMRRPNAGQPRFLASDFIRPTTSYIVSKPISKTASQKVKLLTANVRQIEEKRTAENNSPLDYSREGILTSFSGTLKLSANQLALTGGHQNPCERQRKKAESRPEIFNLSD